MLSSFSLNRWPGLVRLPARAPVVAFLWGSWLLVTQQLRRRHNLRRCIRRLETIRYSCSWRQWSRDIRWCSTRKILRKIQRRSCLRVMRQRNIHICMMEFF
jgi:hypothetical protein